MRITPTRARPAPARRRIRTSAITLAAGLAVVGGLASTAGATPPRAVAVPPGDRDSAWLLVLDHPDLYAGVQDLPGGGFRLVTTSGVTEAARAALSTRFALSRGPLSYGRLKAEERSIAERAFALNPAAVTLAASDPATGITTVVLRRSDPALADRLRAEHPGRVRVSVDPRVPVQHAVDNRAYDRNIALGHFGGSEIALRGANGTATAGRCTTAFSVVINAQRWMMTAGHCFPTQDTFTVHAYSYLAPPGTKTGTPLWFGRVASSRVSGLGEINNTAVTWGDWAVLGGSGYSGLVYDAGPAPSVTTVSQHSMPILADQQVPPAVGDRLCTSGATTGQV